MSKWYGVNCEQCMEVAVISERFVRGSVEWHKRRCGFVARVTPVCDTRSVSPSVKQWAKEFHALFSTLLRDHGGL